MNKIEIKTIYGEVIFSHEQENNTIKATIMEAIKNGTNLCGADLCGANLCCANLCSADLRGADLCGANLRDADLCGANLRDADLHGADLCCANLCGADLSGANLSDTCLYKTNLFRAYLRSTDLGEYGYLRDISDIFIVGPIGSRNDYTTFFHTEKGIFAQSGCFRGNLDEFIAKVKETHKDNHHAMDYLAIAEMVRQKYYGNQD